MKTFGGGMKTLKGWDKIFRGWDENFRGWDENFSNHWQGHYHNNFLSFFFDRLNSLLLYILKKSQ